MLASEEFRNGDDPITTPITDVENQNNYRPTS